MFGIGTHIWLLVGKNLWLLEQIGLTKRGLIEMDIHSGNFNTESRSMNQAKKTEMKGRRERSVQQETLLVCAECESRNTTNVFTYMTFIYHRTRGREIQGDGTSRSKV